MAAPTSNGKAQEPLANGEPSIHGPVADVVERYISGMRVGMTPP
jgi:hypothetical protein